ncbi:MAG: cobalt-precorrin-5B (C(1))-methyltransferase [Thermodesulfobacteriota bacterium]
MAKKRLRSGYTTGACAAAAAKAAVLLAGGELPVQVVDIPFPDGSRHTFTVHYCGDFGGGEKFRASVIKDAGDDPDVTNGAEIVATIREIAGEPEDIIIRAGDGVGTVTKPGLAIAPGEPAINPVPRQMIREAVHEIWRPDGAIALEVEISIPDGRELAKKTLNYRLGIIGGLSVLGTTGIVRPVSAEAWTATITASMDVARAAGLDEVILSTGRTSEKGAFSVLSLEEEAGVMMGDYLEFSLQEAARHGFGKINLAGMWAKVLKAAMEIPQTHVRHGALETGQALEFLAELGAETSLLKRLAGVNTAREIYERLVNFGETGLIEKVCVRAREYAMRVSGLEVTVYLVHASGKVVVSV